MPCAAVVPRIPPRAYHILHIYCLILSAFTMDMTIKLTKTLIDMYWERKCLWQVRSEDYKKRDLKKKAYLEIVAFLRRNGVGDADVKLVRDKIQNLRRAMRKEKKKIDDSGGTYSPTLWYYDLLTFVNCQYEESSKSYTMDANDFDGCDSKMDRLDEDQNGEPRKPSTSTNTEPIQSTENLVIKPDEFEAMGINVAAKVRRMEPTQQVYAELLIQKVLARGLLGQLGEATDLVDLVPESGPVVRLGPVVPATDAYRRVSGETFVNRTV